MRKGIAILMILVLVVSAAACAFAEQTGKVGGWQAAADPTITEERQALLDKALEKLVAMTNFGNDEAIRRFQYIWRMKGLDAKLLKRGIKEGDTVRIGTMEFEYHA